MAQILLPPGEGFSRGEKGKQGSHINQRPEALITRISGSYYRDIAGKEKTFH